MAEASGAQTERRGVPRPVRLPRGSEDAPADFFPPRLFHFWVPIQKNARLAKHGRANRRLFFDSTRVSGAASALRR